MQYLCSDPRWEIKSKTLQHLYELAKPGAHLWPNGSVDNIIDVAIQTESQKVLNLALSNIVYCSKINRSLTWIFLGVILVLVESPKICHEYQMPDSRLRLLCSTNSFSSHPTIAAKSIQILTEILSYW